MKTTITGYSEVSKMGANGEQLMDTIVEEIKEEIGSKVEYDGEDSAEINLYKVTIIVEKLTESMSK